MNMDRFKVRVWCEADNEMTYPHSPNIDGEVSASIFLAEYLQAIWENEPDESIVLMQCTGLKDSEGKLIWEGDVLHHIYCDMIDGEDKPLGFDYLVIWKDYTACFALKQILTGNEMEIIMDYKDLTGRTEKVTVLGNIYEHPSLLEAEK